MKTYRRHNCTRNHRTYRVFAECTFPRAAWVTGEGQYASLAWCQVLTVMLFDNLDDATHAKDFIDDTGCGHACYHKHELVQLAK